MKVLTSALLLVSLSTIKITSGSTVPQEMFARSNQDEENTDNAAMRMMMNVLNAETQTLYDWLMTQQNTQPTTKNARRISPDFFRKIICFPKKGCIDMADVGIHP